MQPTRERTSGDGGYDRSTKLGLLLLKEEINKLLRQYEDSLNEMPAILSVFDLERSPDFTAIPIAFPIGNTSARYGLY